MGGDQVSCGDIASQKTVIRVMFGLTRVQTPAGLRCPQEAVQWVPILMWASVRGALVVVWGAFLLTFQHKGAGSVYDLIGGDLGPLEGESENHPY